MKTLVRLITGVLFGALFSVCSFAGTWTESGDSYGLGPQTGASAEDACSVYNSYVLKMAAGDNWTVTGSGVKMIGSSLYLGLTQIKIQ